MGVWGPGNFENDYAADHLYRVCGPLLRQIEEAMNDPSLLAPDEDDSYIVMANLEILACLAEHLGRYQRGLIQDFLYPSALPPPETIAAWKQKFLQVWDAGEMPDQMCDSDKKRREVIVETFDRVEQLARGGNSS
jgi:uncharacterized protein DUF4259